MRKSKKLEILILSLIFLFLFITVPITGYFNFQQGVTKQEKGLVSNLDRYNNGSFSGILLDTSLSFIDANTYSYRMHIEGKPVGTYSNANGDSLVLSESIILLVNGKPISILAGSSFPPQDLSLVFSSGLLNNYPFELYKDSSDFAAYSGVLNETIGTQIVPIALQFNGAYQGWTIASDLLSKPTLVSLYIEFQRSFTVKFFSIFVTILMWIISLSILILAVTLNIRKRRVEPPTIAVSAVLLFALPSIRNAQPSVPPVGITLDAISFFWNMAIGSIALILLLWNYILFYQKEVKVVSLNVKEMQLHSKEQETVERCLPIQVDSLLNEKIN